MGNPHDVLSYRTRDDGVTSWVVSGNHFRNELARHPWCTIAIDVDH